MFRCCSKLVIPLPSRSGSPVCISRIYVASSNQNFNQRRYASGESQSPRRFKKVFYTTIGLTLVGVGGVVVYAKSDPKFRKVLDSYVPGTDSFIRIIYQEDGSFDLDITDKLSSIQDKVLSLPGDIYKQISGSSSEETPSVLPKVKELKSEEIVKPKPKPAVDTSRKQPALVRVSGDDLKPLAEDAIRIYKKAIALLEDAGKEIIGRIDLLDDTSDQKALKEIRDKIEEKNKLNDELSQTLKEADEKAKKFLNMLKSAKDLLSDAESLKTLEVQLLQAKEKAESLKDSKFAASKKYFEKIEESQKKIADEISTLFPGARLGSGRLSLKDDEIDLFLYYAYQKIQYLQREINKHETVIAQKLKKALDSKDDSQLIQAAIAAKVEEARNAIKEDYDKKMVELKSGCDQDLHNQMKRQEQIHMDLLNEKLALKEKEVERKLMQRMEDKVLEEQRKLQEELADMTGRMQGLNKAIATRALQDQKAQTSQALWSAAEALYDSLKHGKGKDGKLKPLAENVEAIKNASAKGDDLVETVLATIPKVALERGVYPEDMLRDRFLKVEKVAWRVAGVPEGGASLGKLLIASLQSALVIKASEPIPPGELNNEPFDPSSLNNYDILQRARYYVDRGDFEQALKYMNLLKGGARAIASDWMKEVTTLLETQQAAELLLAHASASGMIYS